MSRHFGRYVTDGTRYVNKLKNKFCFRGTRYVTDGTILKGFGPGSKVLGIPTEHPSGVYFGWAGIANRSIYKMVMSIGLNPYFSNSEKTIVSK